jgi:peptidoglycan/LPS O-acetylase OafA/YrhL
MNSLLTPPSSPVLKKEDDDSIIPEATPMYQTFIAFGQRVLAAALTLRTWMPTYSSKQNQRLRPTAYLDGLRGFAAVLVYFMHHEVWAHESIFGSGIFENAFGYQGRYYFTQLPGIRLLFAGGHFSVAIFFIISGYVLAAKPLTHLRDRNLVKMGDSLASAFFRRWVRLYMPLFATTFLYMFFAWMIPGLETNIKPEAKFGDELYRWYTEIKNFSFVFRQGGEPWMPYNFHVWTIPLEFKGSMVIYASVLAFSRCTRKARLFLQVTLMFYFMYIVDGWYLSCFVAGMFLVEVDLMEEFDQLPEFITKLRPHKTAISYTALFVALYLGGVPCLGLEMDPLREAWGWHYLSYLKPSAVFMPKSFYLSIAAFILVPLVPRIKWLKTFFELPLNQHFGRISYAFYLVHGPVLWTIGNRIYAAIGWVREDNYLNIAHWIGTVPIPKWGLVGLELNFILAQFILFPLTLWVAKLATDAFDGPSIKLAAWLYERVRAKDEETAEKYPV